MIQIIVNNKIELQNYRSIDFSLCKELMKRFEMPNPYTGEIERTLKFWSASKDSLFFPRGTGLMRG